MGNVQESCMHPEGVLDEEFELSAFMRSTMAKSAVSKNVPEFHEFCEHLITLPYDERFLFAFDFFERIDGYPKIERKSMKSSVKALTFKNLGNGAFRQGDLIEALKSYTKSVAVAPVGSSDLAVAYGNRSAVLFELQRYEACIVDINRALGENFPQASIPKLLNRKQKCRSKMMELEIQDSSGKRSIEDKSCEMNIEDALDLDYSGKFPLPKAKLKNKKISNTSDKVKIAVNSTFGRHVVAVKDIKISEIISIEKAYASILLNNYRYSHCANCFLRCEVLIPCPDCSAVMYCSRRCREDDFNRSHRIECQVYVYSDCLGLPLPPSLRLAIQTLIIVTEQGDSLRKLMMDPLCKNPMKEASSCQVPEKLCSQNSIHIILSLLNDDRLYAYPHDPEDESTLSEVALSLYRVIIIGYILKQTTYYDSAMVEKAQDNDSTEERQYVGLLFLKLMVSLPRYSLAVEELIQKENTDLMKHADGLITVGCGYYLFHSLFCHSCYMSVTGIQHKDTMVSQTVQPIKAGQQLFFNYGVKFWTAPRKQRQKELRSGYQFDCRCEACRDDWPVYDKMPCESVSLINSQANLSQLLKYAEKIDKLLDAPLSILEYNSSSVTFFPKFLTTFHNKFKKPSRVYFAAFIIYHLLLQSQGNNYVYTRDDVLMKLSSSGSDVSVLNQ